MLSGYSVCGIVEKMTPHIPEYLVEEVLLRLPAKSLLRFKSVCKSWHRVISSSRFINLHLKISSLTRKTVIYNNPKSGRTYLCYVDDLFSVTGAVNLSKVDLGIVDYISGCCNGLVCVGVHKMMTPLHYYLLNPSTMECREIPLERFQSDEIELFLHCYGLCYDEIHKDYKVVFLLYKPLRKHMESMIHMVMVYSLNSGCWKEIEVCSDEEEVDVENQPTLYGEGGLLNGRLHRVNILRSRLVYFDVCNEFWGSLELPAVQEGNFGYDVRILDECLVVVHGLNGIPGFDVWILKEYGVKESWSILFRVEDIWYAFIDAIISNPKDDRVYVFVGGDFTIYDPVHKSSFKPKKLENEKLSLKLHCSQESLVPVNKLGDRRETISNTVFKWGEALP